MMVYLSKKWDIAPTELCSQHCLQLVRLDNYKVSYRISYISSMGHIAAQSLIYVAS